MSNFDRISVANLIKEAPHFIIPSYQRGYRWERKQVTDLLNDLRQFVTDGNSKNSCYHLQPIVIKKASWKNADGNNIDGWEVLDGQQRLTTMYLLLKYIIENELKRSEQKYFDEHPIYDITYAIRPQLDFKNPKCEDNIDSYYLFEAKEAIEEWFGALGLSDAADKIKSCLILEDSDKQAHFIKYIVNEDSQDLDSIRIFNRLNKGKIGLTNAELIKALLIMDAERSKEYSSEQLAIDWNYMERQFQDESFWAFISGEKEYQDRIDILFDFMTQKGDEDDADFSYRKFQNLYDFELKAGKDVILDTLWEKLTHQTMREAWLEVKRMYDTLVAWYEDSMYYHYVGFLTTQGKTLHDIVTGIEKAKKDENGEEIKPWTREHIETALKRLMAQTFNEMTAVRPEDIDGWTYNGNNDIRGLLLLMNVETYKQTKYQRFPFHSYIKEEWDIEHIDSQNEATGLRASEDRLRWMRLTSDILMKEHHAIPNEKEAKALAEELTSVVREKTENGAIEDKDVKGLDSIYPTLYVKVVEHYSGKISEQQGNKHALGNLTLLDTALNRSYQDAPFPYKRQCVMDTDLRGDKFVPMCTKNVFLKFYTNSNSSASFLDSMRWNKQDQDNYLAAIHKVVDPIFETNI